MKRRDFSISAAATVATPVLLGASGNTWAQGASPAFQQGRDYFQLKNPVAVDAPADRLEVIEFFWYSCGHCNAFEPVLEEWLKTAPKNISFRRIPVIFRPTFIPEQKLYFTLEAMDKVEALHAKVFRTVHVEKRQLNTDDAIAKWAKEQGLDTKQFAATYSSFGVANKVRRAKELQDAYGVEGVPSIGIGGKYYTDGTAAKGMKNALAIVEYFAAKAKV
jgi:protein dithiol oxidoreductase (disulfide-forming)